MAQWDLTESYQRIGKNSGTFSYGGYSYTFVVRTYAKYSGSTIYFYLTITNESSAYWNGTNKHYYVNCNGAGITSLTKFTDYLAPGGAFTSSTYSTNVTKGTYYTLNGAEQVGDGTILATKTVSDSVRIPATAPSTPSVSASNSSNTANSVTYGTSSFGNPSSGTVYLYGGTSASPTSQIASKTTTGNSSYSHTGLTGNTRYYYRSRASNGQLWSSYSSDANVLTRPTTPSAVTLTVTGTTTATLKITSPSQGSSGTMTAYYKLNSGSYTSAGTITSGGTVTKNLTGLTAGTSYTATAYINNATANSGTKSSSAVTTYKVPAAPTVSASNTSATANSITYGTSSFNTPSTGTVYLYGGTSASPTTQIARKTTTGNSSYSHTGLTGNTKYYYRSRANNTGGNSSYSSDATTITKPAAPTLTVSNLKHNKATISVKSPTQGSANTMTAYYTLNGGTAVSMGTVTSGNTVTATPTLTPRTSYTIVAYLSTSAGNSTTVTQTVVTPLPFYARVSGKTKYTKTLYCSVSGKTKKVKHLYGSVNGVTKKIF